MTILLSVGQAQLRSVRLARKISISQLNCCRTLILQNTKDLSSPFPDVYDHTAVEKGWYDWWRGKGYFQPRPAGHDDGGVPTFSMVLPPPNVTGTLHLGHALTCVIQDSLCRWHRMRGHRVVWVPGSDHAGIATQMVVERSLQKRGTSREELGREKFLEEVLRWKEEKGNQIFQQLEALGASLDWERLCFTMSKEHSDAVNAAFQELFKRGLIYRGQGLVNWSCHLRSAISDIEVRHVQVERRTRINVPGYEKKQVEFGVIYDVAYRLKGSSDVIVVSTTRPETILGDVAVAVHSEDERFKNFVGKELEHPFRGDLIPVIADSSVQRDFGTGAVKITPGHDFNDFVIGQRHKLPVMSVIDEKGLMCCHSNIFHTLPRFTARFKVLEELKKLDLFRGSRTHPMQVPICSRSGDVVEPLIKPQWYVKCDELAAKAMEAANNGELRFHPDHYHAVWNNWLGNIKDWCISRQLWWGHRIPAFHCTSASGVETWICAGSVDEALRDAAKHFKEEPSKIKIRQDEDVLDTWFSSALIPFANFGWPSKNPDVDNFYPLTLMETGHDILFFWVARMVWMGMELTGKLPFSDVVLHGMICDSQGRKMSKSLGNVIDPLFVTKGISREELESNLMQSNARGHISNDELDRAMCDTRKDFPHGIPACGTDALRFGLCYYEVKSQQIKLDVTIMKTSSAFCNKIWQATRYLVMSHQRAKEGGVITRPLTVSGRTDVEASHSPRRPEDTWILSRCAVTVKEMNEHLECKDFHLAARAIRRYMYTNLCDVYLEATKPILSDPTHPSFAQTFSTLHASIMTGLKLLHPIMPFVTEELYNRIPVLEGEARRESIMIEEYPQTDVWDCLVNDSLMDDMDVVQEIVSSIRDLKKTFNISRSSRPDVVVCCAEQESVSRLSTLADLIETLAPTGKTGFVFGENDDGGKGETGANYAMAAVRGTFKILVRVDGLLNVEQEIGRNEDNLSKTKKGIDKLVEKCKKNPRISEAENEKLATLRETVKQLEKQIVFLHQCKQASS